MNKCLGLVVLGSLSCGVSDQVQTNLGTLSSPVYIPSQMGMEKGDGSRCDSSWSGGVCYVPDSKTVKFYVDGQNCPVWYKQRIQNAVIDMNTLSSPYGWSTQLVGINEPWNFTIYCETESTRPTARTWFNDNFDCHDTDLGDLCQTRTGYIAVRPNYAESKGVFKAATTQQRIYWMANSMRHEVGHAAFNFGHLPGTQQGTKLMAKGYPDDLDSPVWNSFLTPDQDEQHALDCYTPGSSGSSSCQ